MKNLLLIILFATFSAVAFSQQGLHLGIKGAPQSTWMFNSDDSDDPEWLFENTVRASFGASFAYFFSEKVGLGVDFLYSAQGQKFEFEFAGVRANGFTKLSYFKIPILFHYHSNSESTALFYLNAVLSLAY